MEHDVHLAINNLPKNLKDLCTILKDGGDITEASKRLKKLRAEIYKDISDLRCIFQDSSAI